MTKNGFSLEKKASWDQEKSSQACQGKRQCSGETKARLGLAGGLRAANLISFYGLGLDSFLAAIVSGAPIMVDASEISSLSGSVIASIGTKK